MQEKQPDRPCASNGYEPCGDEVLDTTIISTMSSYYEDLVNGARTEFRQKPVKERWNDICWSWAQHPETKAASARFKAQVFARALAKVALADDPDLIDRKGIPLLDDYWVEVDQDLQEELRGFTDRHEGIYYDYALNHSIDQRTNYLTVASIGEFAIYRRDLIRGGQSIHIDYLACHGTKNVQELPS